MPRRQKDWMLLASSTLLKGYFSRPAVAILFRLRGAPGLSRWRVSYPFVAAGMAEVMTVECRSFLVRWQYGRPGQVAAANLSDPAPEGARGPGQPGAARDVSQATNLT